jgi:hypothetical protein
MTYATSQLANGQLANSIGDIYTSTSCTTIVKSITLVNTNTTHEHVNLYVLKSGGTARRIIPQNMTLNQNYSLVLDTVITLGSGDKLQGDTTTASKVDYVISGATQAV